MVYAPLQIASQQYRTRGWQAAARHLRLRGYTVFAIVGFLLRTRREP